MARTGKHRIVVTHIEPEDTIYADKLLVSPARVTVYTLEYDSPTALMAGLKILKDNANLHTVCEYLVGRD
jgi:hypothetical protein